MKQRPRIYYSDEQKAIMWDRWKKGDSLQDIARLFDRNHSSISGILSVTGGIRPPQRLRSHLALSLSEREEISRGVASQESFRSIAHRLGRSPSTISREIKRNDGYQQYRATQADQAAWDRAKRPKLCKLSGNQDLIKTITCKLQSNWSPQQIAGWLKREFPTEEHNQVSHETIYRSLYVQTRGVLKKELIQYLRTRRIMRRSKHSSLKGSGLGQITDTVSISERPATIEDRAIPGHWEGDLIAGSKNSYIVTLVERHSRFVMLAKIKDRKSESVVSALIKQAKKLPNELYKSLTLDRGTEFADHRRFKVETNIDVYFCDPNSPWQRGSNENTNRLLRQYFPKGTDLSVHSQAKLSAVARQLNERPRKTLNYETPAERFKTCVASTG
ncbi:IS30 family transposase [Methylotenera mobilis]|jgi:IS30 family transposase|uniref:IS30 family transposase n=1 Tax=Methylotenera mobilis TaxID=359408 RepID=UPI000367961E|nr:IS30 family transposase [Methylotenera mobilis]